MSTISDAPKSNALHGWFLLAFYSIAVLWGISPSVLLSLALNMTVAWWTIHDSVVRKHPIPLFSRNWFILMPGLLTPLYLLWSRGWRGAALAAGHAIAWCAVSFVVAIVA